MSNDKQKRDAEARRRMMRNAVSTAQQPLLSAIENDTFTFQNAEGTPVTIRGQELTPERIAQLAREGYTGSIPLAHSTRGWVEGRVENARNMSIGELQGLQVLRGAGGTRPFMEDADEVIREEFDNENGAALVDSIRRVGSFGLAGPGDKDNIARNAAQISMEENPLVNVVGTTIATAPAMGAAALGASALGARAGLAAESFGAGLVDDFAIELAANTQISLADHALQNRQLTAQSLMSDVFPMAIGGTALSAGVRGLGKLVGKALDAKPKAATPAQQLVSETKAREDLFRNIQEKGDLEVFQEMDNVTRDNLEALHQMPLGSLRKVAEDLPAAEDAFRAASYEVTESWRGLRPIVDKGAEFFTEVKAQAPITREGVVKSIGILDNVSIRLREMVESSMDVDARYYKAAMDEVDNFRHKATGMLVGDPSLMQMDQVASSIDSLADRLLDRVSGGAAPPFTVAENIRGLQAQIRTGIKHSAEVLGAGGEYMAAADELSQTAIQVLDKLGNKIGKDVNPVKAAESFKQRATMSDAVTLVADAQKLVDVGEGFKRLGTPKAVEYGELLVERGSRLRDTYAKMITGDGVRPSPMQTYQMANTAGKLAKERAKNFPGLSNLFRHALVAAGFATGNPGAAFVASAGLDAIGVFRVRGDTSKIAGFRAAHASNSRFFQGLKSGSEAISNAMKGKPTQVLVGGVTASGLSGFYSYKSEDEKRAAFDQLSKEVASITADPERFAAHMETTLTPFTSFDKHVADEMANTAYRCAQYLNETMPQSSPAAFGQAASQALPMADVDQWLRTYHVFGQPYSLLHDVAAGTVDRATCEALQIAAPALYQEVVGAAFDAVGDSKDVPFHLVSSLSTLVGFPLDPTLDSGFIYSSQNMGAQTQAQDQAINGTGRQRANIPSQTYVTSVTRVGDM